LSAQTPPGHKTLLVLVAALVSVIVATFTGLIAWMAEPSVPKAVLTAGSAFAASMTLCLMIMSTVGWV
jgi:ABC-type dipeptide/oligopeptide/nickel transport system permease component